METYPAQVKATKIELKSAENFEILFKNRQPIDSYNKVYAILDKSETNKYDYTIYAYDGSVNIRIDCKEYSLKEALSENKITIATIIGSKFIKMNNTDDPIVFPFGYKIIKTCPTMKVKIKVTKEEKSIERYVF